MTTGHVFIAASLDGYIAREDGSLDWLVSQPTESENHGYDAFIASVDGIVMGRGTFETVRDFDPWPYSKPVYVLSRHLMGADIPEHLIGKVLISPSPPQELMQELSNRGWGRAYIDGGRVIQSFLAAGLIDTITLTHIPVLIGKGRPLFGSLPHDVALTHVKTVSFPSGLVSSEYQVQKP